MVLSAFRLCLKIFFHNILFLFFSCRPIASLDHFTAENLVSADFVEEHHAGISKYIKFHGIANQGRTVSIVMRGSNKLMLEESDRSLHDALCVIRCLVKKKFLIAGGGAPGNATYICFYLFFSHVSFAFDCF